MHSAFTLIRLFLALAQLVSILHETGQSRFNFALGTRYNNTVNTLKEETW